MSATRPEAPARRNTYWRSLALVTLVLNPACCLLITAVFRNRASFWPAFGISLAISEIVAPFCFLGVGIVRLLELRFWAARGTPSPHHRTVFYLGLSALFMPAGLWLAFQMLVAVGPSLGLSFDSPDFSDYKFGLFLGALARERSFSGSFVSTRGRPLPVELRVEQAENQRLQAQLSALASQMNPHLLFNAINTVAAHIQVDPVRAEETLLKLAELYRGVLLSSRKQTHSLADELALCRAYLQLEQARFEERLHRDHHRPHDRPCLAPDSGAPAATPGRERRSTRRRTQGRRRHRLDPDRRGRQHGRGGGG